VILPFYSELVRPDFECCALCWTPYYKRVMGIQERFQQRDTKMTKGLEHLSFEEGLKELGLLSLEKS